MRFALLAFVSPLAFGLGCENVKNLVLPNTTIVSATTVAAGAFEPPVAAKGKQATSYKNLPAFCRVVATLAPSADSSIQIEVWLPENARWNGSLQSVGNGAWAGSISHSAMATALIDGYATASTDTGHVGNTPNFITGHPEKVIDFSYRAIHEMTVAAKRIIASNYGRPPLKSYFNGCSTGGRQALTEVQRYPGDYDGIIAGASANYTTHLQGAQVWTTTVVNRDPASMIPASKYAMLHEAALKACDGLDGVKDGVIENPMKCKFDPRSLVCKGADTPTCLTSAQAEAARLTYQGPRDAKGASLFPGLEPGSETGWNTLSSSRPMALAAEVYKFLVFGDPNWNYLTFEAGRDIARAEQTTGALMDSIDPNLRPFFYRGGKLLMYHGWADPGIAPRNSVNYYQSVIKTVGRTMADDGIRLFMVPGMGHCAGGDGTSTFNLMSAMRSWAEEGHAPHEIPASRVRDGKTDRTRPLCAYPTTAHYDGSGSTDEAANFSCKP
jgi:feruloyl esterase